MWFDLDGLMKDWAGKRVLVIGDIMVDVDLHTKFVRQSNEFDGKIYQEGEEILYPGGAANVAQICASLGAQTMLMGPLGNDNEGMWLRRFCEDNDSFHYTGYMGAPHWQQTTTKTRLFQDNQFICRIDRDVHNEFPVDQLRRHLHPDLLPYDALLLSDYRKGCFLDGEMMRQFIQVFRGHSPHGIVGVNPKPRTMKALCGGLSCGIHLVSLNDREYRSLTMPYESPTDLVRRLAVGMVIHTEGERGLTLHRFNGPSARALVERVENPDVVGCGDAVFAAAVLARTVTEDISQIATIAAVAGTTKAAKRGTVPVTCQDLRRALTPGERIHA